MVEVEYIGKRQEDDLLNIINYEADGRAESESRFESISVPTASLPVHVAIVSALLS